jgi:hypothetical protein
LRYQRCLLTHVFAHYTASLCCFSESGETCIPGDLIFDSVWHLREFGYLFINGEPHGNGRFISPRDGAREDAGERADGCSNTTGKIHPGLRQMLTGFHTHCVAAKFQVGHLLSTL